VTVDILYTKNARVREYGVEKTANSFSISETHIIYVQNNTTLIDMCTGAIILPGFHSVSVCNAVT